MKHTINKYESDTLNFHDTIEISPREEGVTNQDGVKIVATNYYKGERSTSNDNVIIRLDRDQTIDLIKDLAQQLNIEARLYKEV